MNTLHSHTQPSYDLARENYKGISLQCHDCATRFESMFISTHPAWVYGPLPLLAQQIAELNWFWRLNLGLLSNDTICERSALIDNIDSNVWLDNFEKYVLPTVVNEELPKLKWSNNYVGI